MEKTHHLYNLNFFSFHYYSLKPIHFTQTYCLMIFAQILLKFHDIGSL